MRKLLLLLAAVLVLCAFVSCKPEPHVHKWNDGEITVANCYHRKGSVKLTCSDCGESIDVAIAKAAEQLGDEEGLCPICGAYSGVYTEEYAIGSTGPGGGFVFYDVDADNTQEDPDGDDNLKSSVCGWRYLEISSTILDTATHINCYSTKDPNDPASFDESPSHFLIPDPLVTGAAIGDGKANTETFYGLFTQGYLYSPNWQSAVAKQTAQNSVFALVKASQEGGKSDWFIPSVGELIAANSAGFTFEMPNFGIWSSTRMTNENTNRTMKNGASSTDNQGPNSRWYKIRQF